MNASPSSLNEWPPEREALLRATMSLTVAQRIEWLEQMMRIAASTGALPKRPPDQMRPRQGDAAEG